MAERLFVSQSEANRVQSLVPAYLGVLNDLSMMVDNERITPPFRTGPATIFAKMVALAASPTPDTNSADYTRIYAYAYQYIGERFGIV